MFRIALLSLLTLTACSLSTHAARPSTLGTASSSVQLLEVIDQPGPLEVETVASVDWQVTRGGLINLKSEKAKAAHLEEGDEPIQVYFHVIRHPTKGVFLVDTGFEKALRDDPSHAAVRGLVASFMHTEKVVWHAPLAEWLAAHPEPVTGVFYTHLHLDHVSGTPDLPATTALYAGPNEMKDTAFSNLVVQANIDRALEGKGAVNEWQFKADPSGRFVGVLDVFGDGSLWALHVPGHTPGSTAYLARTTRGPVLMVGDASHTVWGWQNDVEPGEFTSDLPTSIVSLHTLRTLVAEHPTIDVRLGHQRLPAAERAHAP